MKYCFVIPNYNHKEKIAFIVSEIATYGFDIIIVDDASDSDTKKVLAQLSQQYSQIHLVTHAKNQGKGGAVMSGVIYADTLSASHVIQVDADGQHDLLSIDLLLDKSKKFPKAVISGQPVYDQSVPKGRLYSRYITHFWVWIETLSFTIKDSMCGFRIYPVEPCCRLFTDYRLGKRMDFDIEVLVRLFWRGIAIHFIKTPVVYPEDGISHFQPFKDNLAISWLHTRLFFGMLLRSPKLLVRKFKGGM